MEEIPLNQLEQLMPQLTAQPSLVHTGPGTSVLANLKARQTGCHIAIWEDSGDDCHIARTDLSCHPAAEFIYGQYDPRTDQREWERFTEKLAEPHEDRTRWIHVVGTSSPAPLQQLDHVLLEGTSFFSAQECTGSAFGGPVNLSSSQNYLWLQMPIWLLGQERKKGSALSEVYFKVLLVLPTASTAGTFVTCVHGEEPYLSEAGRLVTDRLIRSHSLHLKTLRCVWTLTFALMRIVVEQMERLYPTLNTLGTSSEDPLQLSMHDLPDILGTSHRLRMIDRYLTDIEEITMFLTSAKDSLGGLDDDHRQKARSGVAACAALEVRKTIDKVSYGRRLCKTYIEHTRELVQIVLLHQSTRMNARLDRNNDNAQLMTKLGLAVAGLASVLTPLAVLTSYFGMNVEEFVPGATLSLFDFWTIGIPIVLGTAVPLAFICVWIFTKKHTLQDNEVLAA